MHPRPAGRRAVAPATSWSRPASRWRPGQIRDSNRATLLALVAQQGWQAVDLGLIRDDEAAITAAIQRGRRRRCDAVLTSGGVSMGDIDLVKVVLDRIGDMRWMQIAIRPAKPFAFGAGRTARRCSGCPGNPVSSMVSFELLARPALRRMAGHAEPAARRRCRRSPPRPFARRPDGKIHFVRVRGRAGRRRRAPRALGRRPGLAPPHRHGPRARPAARSPTATASTPATPSASSSSPTSDPAPVAWTGDVRRARRPRCPDRWSTRSGACTATCASRSPIAATSAAPTACPRRGCSGCPGRRCSPSRSSSGWPACSSSATASARSASPVASRPCGPTSRCSWRSWRRSRSTWPSPPTAPPSQSVAPGLAAAGLRRVNVSLDTLRPERFAELTRRDQLADVLDGIDAALEAGLAPVKVNVVVRARRQRRRGRRPGPLRARPRRHRALHRVDAARRRRRLDRATRSSPRPRSSSRSTRCSRSSRSPRGSEPAERFRYLDGARRGRRDPERHPPVLRAVRPHPPHRRRPAPQLPVLARGPRPARARCAPGPPTTSCPTPSRPASAPSGPATPSARCSS